MNGFLLVTGALLHVLETKPEEKILSRSFRKSPFCGMTTAESEKKDKQLAHRRERRIVRQILDSNPLRPVLPHRREVSNVWSFDKDGKQRLSTDSPYYLEIMRK